MWMICLASVLLIVIGLVVFSLTRFDGDDSNFAGGYGTREKPYLISTPRQLDHLSQCLGMDFAEKYYKLENDIVFTPADFDPNGAFYNEGQGWTPIGSFRDQYSPEQAFCANFDGNGKTIEGLVCRTRQHRSVGLFGALYGASVSNLLLKNARIRNQCPSLYLPHNRHDRSATGALAGRAYLSRIQRVGIQADIEGFSASGQYRDMSGGLVGELCNSRVEDCYTAGSVRESFYAGGIAGEAFSPGTDPTKNTLIERCFSTAALHGGTVGGIAGTTAGDAPQTRIACCFALNKEVIGNGQYAGIANVYSSTILTRNYRAATTLIKDGKAAHHHGEPMSFLRSLDQATWESLSFEFGDSAEKPWTWVQGKYPELRFSWLLTGSAGKSDSSQGPSPITAVVQADRPAASAHHTPVPVQPAPETVKPLPEFSLVATWDGFDPVLQLKIQFIFTPDGKVTRTGTPLGWNVVSYKKKNDRAYDLFNAQGNYVQKLEVIDENNIVLCWNSPLGDVKATRSNPGGTAAVKAAPPAEPQPMEQKVRRARQR